LETTSLLAPAPRCIATCGRATRVDIADVDGGGSDYMVVMAVAAALLSVGSTPQAVQASLDPGEMLLNFLVRIRVMVLG